MHGMRQVAIDHDIGCLAYIPTTTWRDSECYAQTGGYVVSNKDYRFPVALLLLQGSLDRYFYAPYTMLHHTDITGRAPGYQSDKVLENSGIFLRSARS